MQYVTKEMLKDSGKMDMAAKAFSDPDRQAMTRKYM